MLIFTDNVYNDSDPECEIEELRSLVIANIDRHATWKRIQVAGAPSPEQASWKIKADEAAIGGGPILATEAKVRGIDLADLCQRVLSNAAAFGNAEAYIAGTSGKQRDTVSQLKTREELLAFDWRF